MVKMRRHLLWVSVVAALALAGCGNSMTTNKPASPRFGALTGVAEECSGLAKSPARPVQVIVYRGSEVVVKQTKLGSHSFRFSLPAGKYTVTTNQSAVVPVTVTLRAGGIANAGLVNAACD